jgi:lysyl-tRNA synthetase, class II
LPQRIGGRLGDGQGMEFSELQAQRFAKLERMREDGIEPFPARAERTHTIAKVLERFDELLASEQRVSITGRIVLRRVMGKSSFAQIDDGSGSIQIFLSQRDVGERFYEHFKQHIDLYDIVGATGRVFVTKMGERSVFVERWTLLAKALNPPPDKWHGLTDVEARLRERYADLVANAEVRAIFRARALLIATMRRYLDGRGFLEVETPVLQPIYGGASARPFVTHHNQLHQDLYLRIAVELYLKRLIVGMYPGVYEIGKNFRNEGVDRSHNTEFTMMEVYEAYADYTAMIRIVEEVCRDIAVALTGGTNLPHGKHTLDFGPAWQRISMPQAILESCGVDIRQHNTLDALWAACKARGLRVERKATWGKQVDEVFSTYVQPDLIQPTFVLDYPVEVSPLAKRKPDDPDYVERFEAFVAGMEIANGYSELNDPLDQEQRFLEQVQQRQAGDDEAQQMDLDYVNALMYGMPPTGGLGMGIDRMTMIFTNQDSIREVILFPHLRQVKE